MKIVRKISLLLAIVLVAVGAIVVDRTGKFAFLDKLFPKISEQGTVNSVQNKIILNEENVVVDVAEKVSPTVVTVSIKTTKIVQNPNYNFFVPGMGSNMFQQKQIEQDIGTGFIIDKSGLIVTNKHVVDNLTATYKVITKDDKTYDVEKIYRDPTNDLAILKINPSAGSGQVLQTVTMGDSGNLKVGQFVIAIGTALGEFRHTVTTGVVSGLGRGIDAGSPYEGSVERLDNVIQTDAAINPGNSGGPLLNSVGQVIGVNTAVSSQGQNIGFAIPINVIKEAIDNFNQTGQFNRPYLGVRYRMINLKTALQYEVPQGAYIQEIIAGSPAEKAGLEAADIITKMDDNKLMSEDNAFAKAISTKKVGDKVKVEYFRNGETKTINITLEEAK